MERSSDEKLWACLAYLGNILLCCGVLPVAAIVIFFMKKDESQYLKFHTAQALALGVVCFGVWLVLTVVNMVVSLITSPVAAAAIGWGLVGMVVFPLVGLAIIGYWIYLSILAYRGEDFEVPYIGNFVHEKLG